MTSLKSNICNNKQAAARPLRAFNNKPELTLCTRHSRTTKAHSGGPQPPHPVEVSDQDPPVESSQLLKFHPLLGF